MTDTRDPSESPREIPESGVPERAAELVRAAEKKGRGLLDRQKHAAAEELSSVSQAMRDAARTLDEDESGGVGRYVEKAAQLVDRVSAALEEHDVPELVERAEHALRERTAVALGITAGLGFILGRVLRAGSQRIVEGRRGKGSDSEESPK